MFLALATQWRREYAGMNGQLVWQGLRYAEAEAVMRMLAIPRQDRADTLMRLRTLEAAALPLLNKPV